MSPEQLEEIEKRAEKATPGPWQLGSRLVGSVQWGALFDEKSNLVALINNGKTDEAFIVASRTDIPALCKALREAWARSEKCDEAIRLARSMYYGMKAERDALKAEVEQTRDLAHLANTIGMIR